MRGLPFYLYGGFMGEFIGSNGKYAVEVNK